LARCPNCGEPVSQFAAGCAICGADLEAARRKRAARPHLRLPSLPRVPDTAVTAALIGLVVLAFPLLGIVLAFLAARREMTVTGERVMWGLVALGVVLLVVPDVRFGLWQLLG